MEGAKWREGQEEVGVGLMGPENESPVSCGQDFGFYYESNEKSLHGLKQGASRSGSRFRKTTCQVVREREGRQRARGQAGVDYNHLGRGGGGMDKRR